MKNPTPKTEHDKFSPYIYPTVDKIKLERKFKKIDKDFISVYYNRKSYRKFKSLPINKLSELLYHSNRVLNLDIGKKGYIETHRTSPSAGGRHPIDVLVFSPSLKDITGYYYNPLEHSLNEMDLLKSNVSDFLSEVNSNLSVMEGTILWFSIQKEKTESKYFNSESLYWKDLGALIYNIQLVCSYLEIVSCPLGTLASDNFNRLFETEKLLSGGGILIGAQ